MLETVGVVCVMTICLGLLALLQHRRTEGYAEARWLATLIYLTPATMSALCWGALSSYLPFAIFELLFRLVKSACLITFKAYLDRLVGRTPNSPLPEYSETHVELALAKADHIQPLPPFCCLRPLPLRNLEEVQTFTVQTCLGIWQFIVLSPLLLVTGILLRYLPAQDLLLYGEASPAGAWLYICVGSTVSALLAAYWVLLYAQAIDRTPNCEGHNAQLQSIWVICVVMVTEVQKLVIALLTLGDITANKADYSAAEISEILTDVLCCGEMLIATATVIHLFPPISPSN